MLTSEELNRLQSTIERKIRMIGLDIEHLVELTQPIAPENALGRVTRMDAINNKSVHEATLRQARQTLASLEHALQRVGHADVSLGTCSSCKGPIPFQRMLVMPESDKCIRCAN